MTLDVLIATLGVDGINRVAETHPPATPGVRYIVSWQLRDNESAAMIPDTLIRDDIEILPHHSIGLSCNRNHALKHAKSQLCLLSDDDVRHTSQSLTAVIEVFERNQEVDIATFQYTGDDNKIYPTTQHDLRHPPKGYYISEIEIAFRRERILAHDLWFNEDIGLGGRVMSSAEGDLWLHTALHAGLIGRYFPICIAHHTGGVSTGMRATCDPRVLMAQGMMIYLTYPYTWILRIPLTAWRRAHNGIRRFWPGICDLIRGVNYARRKLRRDGRCK